MQRLIFFFEALNLGLNTNSTTNKVPKRQGSLGNVGIMGFVFTNFQADNYGTSSGDDEGNCVGFTNKVYNHIQCYIYCFQFAFPKNDQYSLNQRLKSKTDKSFNYTGDGISPNITVYLLTEISSGTRFGVIR